VKKKKKKIKSSNKVQDRKVRKRKVKVKKKLEKHKEDNPSRQKVTQAGIHWKGGGKKRKGGKKVMRVGFMR
jgi:hypothetical protein